MVVPLSTSPTARPPLTVAVSSAGRPAVAVLDLVRATAKERFGEKLCVLNDGEFAAVEDALRSVLGLG